MNWNTFVEIEDIPYNGVILARVTDNVLDEEHWHPFEIEINNGVVVRIDDEDPFYLRMVGWDRKMLSEWTQYDATGNHPETYHEICIVKNEDMCPHCGMTNGDHIIACVNLTDEMWARR